MSLEACFDPVELAEVASGRYPADRRGRVEAHLADCAACRGKAARLWEALPGREGASSIGRGIPRWLVGAAASLLVVAGGVSLYRFAVSPSSPPKGEVDAESAPSALPAAAGDLKADAPEGMRYRLSDGTLLTLEQGARVRMHPTAWGERARLELREGALEAKVASGKGAFRIETPAGEIRVLGTRFTAKAFRMHLLPAAREVLAVALEEGKIEVSNPQGRVTVGSSARVLAFSGEAPVSQESRFDAQAALRELSRGVRPPARPGDPWVQPGSERGVAALAASLWLLPPGIPGGWARRVLDGESSEPRLGAALLVGLCGSPPDLDALRQAAAAEPDVGARGLIDAILKARE